MRSVRIISSFLLITISVLAGAVHADDSDFLLIRRDLRAESIKLVEVNQRALVHVSDQSWETVPLEDCIALLRPGERGYGRRGGLVMTGDGQRLPGEPISNATSTDRHLIWDHRGQHSLGRINVPLDDIASILFLPNIDAPGSVEADAIVLINGDRLDGFIIAIGDPVTIEVDDERGPVEMNIPLNRIAALSMVTQRRQASGTRLWLGDGTVLDVRGLELGDDGWVHFKSAWIDRERESVRMQLADIDAVLFGGDGMLPLARLGAARVEGPPTRYYTPPPLLRRQDAPLELAAIELVGPLVVHYALPSGSSRFAAHAVLPPDAREWGDFDLLLRVDGVVVFRATLNNDQPGVEINIPIDGAELTIELVEGANGPVQDRLLLERAMLLVGAGH